MKHHTHHSFVRWVVRAGLLVTFVSNGWVLASIATQRPLETSFGGSVFTGSSSSGVQAIFDERLKESIKYQRGAYKFPSPSQ